MHPEIENLINIALVDGEVTEKERRVIIKKATELGVDADEVEMVLDGKLHQLEANKLKQKEKVGNIKTCPACGASVKALSVSCFACSFDFKDLKINISVAQLKEKLESAKDEKERMKILKNFTPNKDMESVIDALYFLLGQVVSENLSELEMKTNNILKQKSQEILSRSEIYFARDKKFKDFANDFSKGIDAKFKTTEYFKKIGMEKQKRSSIFITISLIIFFGVFIIMKKVSPNLHDQQSVVGKIWPLWLILSIVLIAFSSYFNIDYKKHKKRFPFLENYK